MKLPLFCKKPETAKSDTPTSSPAQTKTVSPSPDSVSHAKEGYFVDCSLSYGEPVDFINEQKGIRKPLIQNHVFEEFPGVDEVVEEGRKYNRHSNKDYSGWMKYVARTPIDGYIQCYVLFSRPDEQGQTKVFWMLQPHDTPDESGFGMEKVPELMLSTFLDENGNYTGPFRLESVKW